MTDPFHIKLSENITTFENIILKLSQVCFSMLTEDTD